MVTCFDGVVPGGDQVVSGADKVVFGGDGRSMGVMKWFLGVMGWSLGVMGMAPLGKYVFFTYRNTRKTATIFHTETICNTYPCKIINIVIYCAMRTVPFLS